MNAISEIAALLRNGKSVRQSAEMSGLPITRIETIADGTINPDKVGFGDLQAPDCGDYLLRKGDILISHINSTKHLGKCAIYAGLPPTLVHGMNLLALRVYPDLAASRYVYWILSSPGFRLKLHRITKHSVNQSSFNTSSFKKLRIPLPSLAEQKRIARILDAADALRTKRREAIGQLDSLIQSTFLDMFGDPITNPKGWAEMPLGELAQDSFRNGLSPSTKGAVEGEVLTLSAITRGRFNFAAKKKARFDKQPSPSQRLSTNTFLICRGNGNRRLVGTGEYPDRSSNRVCFPDTMIGVTISPCVLTASYLQNVWRTRRVRRQIERGARTTNGTHKVNQRLLSSIVFPVPPADLQLRFASIVKSVEHQRANQRAHLAELNTLFASLQSRAFRGDL